jgi:MFS family permease
VVCSYIGTVYLLTSTVFLPPFASIADIFGRHWALQLALVFFIIGSAISTGAQNMPMMLAGRGISGIGAAGLLAVSRSLL